MQPKNTIFIGKVLLHFKELDSTNTYAINLLSKSRPAEGTVIITDYQTQGRGQRGNSWHAKAGDNITMSLILYPKTLLVKHQFVLSQLIALAVRATVAEFVAKKVYVKWPNDIYIEEKKVCGLLIQNTISRSNLQSSVIGIGLNVNQKDFPNEIRDKASSLSLESNQPLVLSEVLETLFQNLEQYYLLLKQGKLDKIRSTYLQYLYRYQEWSTFARPNGAQFTAKLEGVNDQGQLLLLHEALEAFNLKEVKFV